MHVDFLKTYTMDHDLLYQLLVFFFAYSYQSSKECLLVNHALSASIQKLWILQYICMGFLQWCHSGDNGWRLWAFKKLIYQKIREYVVTTSQMMMLQNYHL